MKLSFINQYILYLQSLSFVQVQTRPPSPKKVYVFNQPVHTLPAVTQLRTGADKTPVTQESVCIQSTSTCSTCSHSASYRCRQDLRHPRKCTYSINQYILYLQSLSFVQVQTRPPSPKKVYVFNQPVHALPAVTQLRTGADKTPVTKKVYVFNQPLHALPVVTQLRTGADKTSVTQESVRIPPGSSLFYH